MLFLDIPIHTDSLYPHSLYPLCCFLKAEATGSLTMAESRRKVLTPLRFAATLMLAVRLRSFAMRDHRRLAVEPSCLHQSDVFGVTLLTEKYILCQSRGQAMLAYPRHGQVRKCIAANMTWSTIIPSHPAPPIRRSTTGKQQYGMTYRRGGFGSHALP